MNENEYVELFKDFSSLILAAVTLLTASIMYLIFKCIIRIGEDVTSIFMMIREYHETKKLLKLSHNTEKSLKQHRDKQETKKTWIPVKPKEWRKKYYYGKKEDKKQ